MKNSKMAYDHTASLEVQQKASKLTLVTQKTDDSEDYKVLIDTSEVDAGLVAEFEKLFKPSNVSKGHYSLSFSDIEESKAAGVMARRLLRSKGDKPHISYKGGPWNLEEEEQPEKQSDVWNIMLRVEEIPTDLLVEFLDRYPGQLKILQDDYNWLTFKQPIINESDCLEKCRVIRTWFKAKGFSVQLVHYSKSMTPQHSELPNKIPQTPEDDKFLVDLLSGNDVVPKALYGWNALINLWGADEGLIGDLFGSYGKTLQAPINYMTSFTTPFTDKWDCFKACRAIRKFFTSQGSSVKVKPYQENEFMHTEPPKKSPVKRTKAPKVSKWETQFPEEPVVKPKIAAYIRDNQSEWEKLGDNYRYQLAAMGITKAEASRRIGCSATSISNFLDGKPMKLAGVIEKSLDTIFELHNLKERCKRWVYDAAQVGGVQ